MDVTLHDGSTIEAQEHGAGPAVLLPVNPDPIVGEKADELRAWGVDPALGRTLIDGLADTFRVVAFDYEGHRMRHPAPLTLTPDNIAADLLAVADACAADAFAYYGYSWLALAGLQLAIRTDRLSALAMGGFPPIDGPYEQMLRVTVATHELAALGSAPVSGVPVARRSDQPADAPPADPAPASTEEIDWSTVPVTLTPAQTRQFVTLYEALQDFDDRAAQPAVSCPRLCFVGAADDISYSERWGGVQVRMAAVAEQHAELDTLCWELRVLDGLDHTQAMQPDAVLPVLRPWLRAQLIK
jgi:pimeloyl-ACP methyl ester carboxylesterase